MYLHSVVVTRLYCIIRLYVAVIRLTAISVVTVIVVHDRVERHMVIVTRHLRGWGALHGSSRCSMRMMRRRRGGG